MGKKKIHRLLQRYLEGRCTPVEEKLVGHWYQMLDEQYPKEIDPNDLGTLENAIWHKIHHRINDGSQAENQPSIWRLEKVRGWLVAACLAAFLITSGTIVYFRIICHPVKPSFVSEGVYLDRNILIVRNDDEFPMELVLSDETHVTLYPGASLAYPKRFDGRSREVQLVGDAFFSVTANKENPFWVFHEGMTTKVLGTEFMIMAPKGQSKGEVIVYSGKVDVFYNVARGNLVKRMLSVPAKASVTANQRAVLVSESIQSTIVKDPLPINGQFDAVCLETFKDIPMPVLAKALSELYALDVVADSSLAHVTFTGDISGMGLFKQLDIISTVTDIHYEVVGTTISLKDKY